MKLIQRLLMLFALALLTPLAALALDGRALLEKVDRNLEPESYEMTRKLINEEPNGKRKEFILYSVKKGRDKVAALFLAPASDKGRSTLRQGDNMWLYIPNVGKPVRITSLQSVTGGVFNNADILRVDYTEEYDVTAASEAGESYLLELKAKTGAVAYDRLKLTVDRKTVLPTRIEAYAASGLLVKTLYFKDIKDFGGGIRRPATVETDSPLYKGYKSVMLYAAVKKREVPDEVFTLNFMSRLEELRK
ncbi:MAG: outer membrane lipoprotein-sorting protein [Gammaproteobacteria bacterium]|nr:outer membrane lipoprotein-sorting protein [Gammaproteobacteria bacterium]MBU0786172.1 outer membrane lipoprotein-sorting protein [Gammaproteobacteria bacterium]MBU0816753.1 outer membrane lipoprotein-sorting protein [Gammaproteobacteria bacterium]MBU1786917.1 outer membrane lipoprotein-sorting protein [Gammaproteobacteria bacterium]